MTFETKFSHGQHVAAIDRGYATRKVNCSACVNAGKVTINGAEYNCPGCDGRGLSTASVTAWYVGKAGPLAVVTARQHETDEVDVTYMIESTSGRVYDEGDVFDSRENAEAECAKRNADAIERFEAVRR